MSTANNQCGFISICQQHVTTMVGSSKPPYVYWDLLGEQSPTKKQKKYYSGKKKYHVLKTEIVIKDTGQILSVSKMFPGRRHDFRIRKESKPLPAFSNKYVDSGYQGLQKIALNVTLPFRGRKKHPLTSEQKKHNQVLASFRTKVENKIRELKIGFL